MSTLTESWRRSRRSRLLRAASSDVAALQGDGGGVGGLHGYGRQLAEVLEATSDFCGLARPDGRVLYINKAGRRMVGLGAQDDVQSLTVDHLVAPRALERFMAVALPSAVEHGTWRGETILRSRDGTEIPTSQVILAHRSPAGELEMISTIARDIRDQTRSEDIVALHAEVLDRVAHCEPLAPVLDVLVHAIEEITPDVLASVLLVDEEGKHLCCGSAPSLPDAYNAAIDGIAIGPVAGSCGTAAHRAQPVIVEDVMADPLWADFRELAAEHGLRSCWSTPILTGGGEVLGTFALYHRDVRAPDAADRELIAAATHLARTAIEHDGFQRRLRSSERRARDGAEEARSLTVELRDHNDRLRHMADHDPLTGLANRRRLEDELDRHSASARRYGAHGALLLLDLDHFKYVNDALGHAGGDELLIAVATLLRERLRSSDTVARLGGDEFAILLPRADHDEAVSLADELRETIASHTTLIAGQPRRTTVSIGVASVDAGEEASEAELLVRADVAMYEAKDAGRNRVVALSADQLATGATESRVTWVERMRDALANDRFVLHAQPVRPARADGSGERYELLLRLRSESGELVSPAVFLPIAERLALVREIDRWVVKSALELLEDRPGPSLEINLSGRSIGDAGLLDFIQSGLRQHRVDPSMLIFEITETAAVQNFERARVFVERLGELGCGVALDDFGAGFASFYYLKHIPFDYLKIDGEFVRRSLHSPVDQLVIDTVVHIARILGKQTIAECIEDADTAELVRSHGVDYLQGYWIGRPEPVDTLLA